MQAVADAGGGRLASWITPQGFNYGDYGQENNRAPRLLELRNQVYQAAVYGARGFLWYTYSQVPNYPDLDIGMRWLSREIAELKPYLLAPFEEAEITVEAELPEHIHATLRHVGAQRLLIVTSTATTEQEVTLRVPELQQVRALHVVSESRTVAASQGMLRDRFDTYATHIYATDSTLGERGDLTVPTAAIARANAARHKPGNLAFEDSGVRVEVSSESQYGSTPTRLTDGVTHGMRWRDGTPGEYPDWLQLVWPEDLRLGRVAIYANGVASVEVQVPTGDGDWETVGRAAVSAPDHLEIRLDRTVSTRVLRLSIGGNGAGEAHTIVYEVEAYSH